MPAAPSPVPDVVALRQAALQASWRRDRQVRRRRLALRWLLWSLPRLVLPAATLAVAVLWWAYRSPDVPLHPAPTTQPAPSTPPADAVPAPADLFAQPQLRLHRQWPGSAESPATPAASATPGPAQARPVPSPILIPDHWLHSKEP